MDKLNFYDLKTKKKFMSDDYKVSKMKTSRGMKYFAKIKSPSGTKSVRLISKDVYMRNKK